MREAPMIFEQLFDQSSSKSSGTWSGYAHTA